MTIRSVKLGLGAALAAGFALGASAAEDPLEGDLRDLRVGMTVEQLPAEGYVDLACGGDGGGRRSGGRLGRVHALSGRCRGPARGHLRLCRIAARRARRALGGHQGRRPSGDPLAADRRWQAWSRASAS